MRGVIKKEKILVVIGILVLGIALVQLGVLIYTSYHPSNDEEDMVTITTNEEENGHIRIFQEGKEVELNYHDGQKNGKVKRGIEIEVKANPEEGYGVYIAKVDEIAVDINNAKQFSYTYQVTANTSISIEMKRQYTITYDISEGGSCQYTTQKDAGENVNQLSKTGSIDMFEGDNVSFTFEPVKYYEVQKIMINGEEIKQETKDKLIYKLQNISEDMAIKAIFSKKHFAVEILDEEKEFDVWINDQLTRKAELEAGEDCKVLIRAKKRNEIIKKLYVNEKEPKWNKPHFSRSFEYTEKEIERDIKISSFGKIKFEEIKGKFEEVFKVFYIDNSENAIKNIIYTENRVKVMINEKRKVSITNVDGENVGIGQTNMKDEWDNIIEDSCLFDTVYTDYLMNFGVYQYPIQFIFDTISPTISSYKIIQPDSSSKTPELTISSEITDQGDSEIATVQFGTKAEYDARVSAEETQKKYNYNLQNDNSSYLFTLQKTSLKDEEYYIWAIDNATNRSEAMKVDVAGPILTIDTKSAWSNQEIRVKGTAKDDGSRVEQVYYSTDQKQAENHIVKNGATHNVKKALLSKEADAYDFSIEAKQSGRTTYYIWAYDTFGNKSKEIYTYEALLDVKKPVVQLVQKKPSKEWHNDIVTIAFSAKDYDKDEYSGIEKVYYSLGEDAKGITELTVNKDENDNYVIQSPKDKDNKAIASQDIYYIFAQDKAGNISSPLKVEVNIDTEPSKITGVTLLKKNEDTSEPVQGLAHGTYIDVPLLVEVTATDFYQLSNGEMTKASGIKYISLLCNGEQIASKSCDKGNCKEEVKVTFQLPMGFKGNLSLVACDQVGNQSEPISINKVNANYSDYICIEDTKPKLRIKCDVPAYTDQEKKAWYGGEQEIAFESSDAESGLRQIEVKVNGQVITKDMEGANYQCLESNKKVEKAAFKISTEQIGESEDGHYDIEMSAIDNAGNKEAVSRTIYIDRVTPTIEQFSFTANGIKDREDRLIEKQEYGYYFSEPTKVQIKAADSMPSAGIRAIEYYTVDYSSNKDGVASKKTVKEIEQDNTVSFTIDKNFKGQIFARAVDCVEHVASKYSKPYGIIIDSSAGGVTNSQIAFTTPETNKKDSKGNPLYKENVEVNVDVANYYSGIRSVEWEVDSKQDSSKNKSGKLMVSANGKLQGDISNFTLGESDNNLITRLTGNLLITNDSNDIRVHVIVTDRTGKEYEKEMYLSIDKTAPSVELTFDKNTDSVYYNQPRVATIRVRERNFDPEQVKLELYNAAGDVPVLSAWSKKEDSEDPDRTVNTATLVFDTDGIYSLKVLAKDKVENEGHPSQTETFTIDQTKPVLKMSLPRPVYKEEKTNYYNGSIKVRLDIAEDNFEFSKVKVDGKATKEGKQISFPQLEIISSTRKEYNLELEFVEQGMYTFSVSYIDEAGNELQSQEPVNIVIDKAAPEVTITGVKDKMSYNGEVMPEIRCTDSNFTNLQMSVKLYDSMNKEIKFTPAITKLQNGVAYRLDCFPKKKEYDQIYKLVVICGDKAFNVSTKEVSFSVNRFGSTYSFSDSLLNVAGKYVKDEFDLELTEVNVNKLSTDDTLVRLICNDTVKDLVKDQDYSVVESGGNGTWYKYQYRVSSQLIKEDGKYSLAVYSKDEAGNINDNTDKSKKAEIWFGIDHTAPRIVPINIAGGTTYNEPKRQVRISVEDNLVLDHAKIYVNDQEVPYTVDQNEYAIQVNSSNSAQTLKVVAVDQAGNEATKEIKKVYITTNLLVRLVNDRSFLAIGIIIIMIGTIGSAVVFFRYRRKTKLE